MAGDGQVVAWPDGIGCYTRGSPGTVNPGFGPTRIGWGGLGGISNYRRCLNVPNVDAGAAGENGYVLLDW